MRFPRLMLAMLVAALPLAVASCDSDPDVHVVNPPSSTVVTPGSGSTVVVPDDD